MLTPILMWSTTVGQHDAQPVVLYWGVLIFAALWLIVYTCFYQYMDFANFLTLAYANLVACKEFKYSLEDANLDERLG
ncbi:hypothetical protein AOQ84DRAFT_381611 [Glonium stellatum]|uniref:Uncharacterized protein n=1 Tax=Glonium stellatum TaxID=574774 RepID=A0A8E2ERB5_9PEZI|nr:hypothetical protein AOQ84DRAFT_381611 [Glonium stellatum]